VERLKAAAAKATVELETNPTADVNLPFLAADASGPKHLQLTVRSNRG
jgi:molecular chaperone DnaK